MVRLGVGRLATWGAVSTTLALWTVVSAFRQRSNFYAAAVYLSKSNACMMILWNQALFHTVLFGKVLQAIFFGELRLIEVERLQERAWFAVTETLLALTIFRDDFDSSFVVLFVSLLFLKVFHWLAADRVEAMEQAAHVSRLSHVRMVGLLWLLLLADAAFILNAVDSITVDGPTVMIMFASEYLILAATALSTVAKYIINCIDMRRETPWEEKSIYVFYVELTADFFKLVTYLVFFGLILTFYGLPLNILRDVYITLRSFILKVRDLRRYRQATRNMDELYPNASREEMDAMTDRTCIICREDMEYRPAPGEAVAGEGGAEQPAPGEAPAPPQQQQRVGPNDTPKKLPCSHVFHFHCLRSWLERQQSCPTCRRPVLPQEQPPPPTAARGAAPPAGIAAAEDAAMRNAQANIARGLGREAFGALFPGVPFPPEADAGAPAPAAAAGGDNPAARLPMPPSAAQAQARADAGAAALAEGEGTLPPLAGHPRAAVRSSSPAPAPPVAPADPNPNPLARFALPSLSVPNTGEAGLYRRPPAFAYPPPPPAGGAYADVAYGAYPHLGGAGPGMGVPQRAPPPAGSAAPRPNIEEQVEALRRRWAGLAGGEAPAPAGAADGVVSGEEDGEKKVGGEGEGEKKVDKGKGRAVEPEVEGAKEEEEDASLSPREAALRAAERRAGKPVASNPAPPPAQAQASTSSSAATDAAPPPTAPLPAPRLIPLFDPLSPSAASAFSAYPALFPPASAALDALPLLPPAAALSDAERLVRAGVEERLKLLMSFQERIEGLVGEMQEAVRGAPVVGAAAAGEEGAETGRGEGAEALEIDGVRA
ncbi:E3 ubiquitin-protein ligase hrd1 [Rhodotorula kratochvilovae]